MRRGVADLDGKGDAVGGIVVMRYGENALHVIDRAKKKIKELEPTLPEGVKIVTTYDRADLIDRSIETLKDTLTEELLIVSLVILIFLWHVPSAMIPILTIPIAVIISFIPMYGMKITSNIMSLGGIAVAIGAMVDAAIVVVEQTHKKLEHWEATGRQGDYRRVIIDAVKEVGGPSFFALLVIVVSFIPVFTLEAQEGRLFKPLAFTKNCSMMIAAILAITLDPAMRLLFTRMNAFKFSPRWLAITELVLPKDLRPTRYDIEQFDASFHFRPETKLKTDIRLTVLIVHRKGFFDPVDQCELRCSKEIQQNLKTIGVQRKVWSEPMATIPGFNLSTRSFRSLLHRPYTFSLLRLLRDDWISRSYQGECRLD